ncbi:2900_t:CDS:2, partial [Funneliformis caledonium]
LLHDGRWKESNEKLAEITDGILEMLYERQSIASADRRKRLGRHPDIIFVMMDRGKKYELMYTECSCLFVWNKR